jgi:hypothetical protein
MRWLLIAVLLVFVSSCSKSTVMEDAELDLRKLGSEYETTCKNKGIPASNEQFAEWSPEAKKILDKGVYEFLSGYQANQPEVRARIVGYHKDTPEKGGLVLFGDGGVDRLKKDVFEKARKYVPGELLTPPENQEQAGEPTEPSQPAEPSQPN